MFAHIGIVTRKGDVKVGEVVRLLAAHLRQGGRTVSLDSHSAALAGEPVTLHPGPANPGVDLVIAVGGDGTMLAAARGFARTGVPLLGVNLGRLGFLTDLTPDQLPGGLDRILQGQFLEDQRFFLGCRVQRGSRLIAEAEALNDVAILKWNTARLISLDTYIDGRFVHSQRTDGVIICTPTGSTAYALSGGGPILAPSAAAIGLVPICPHSLTNRPLVVGADARIEMVVATSEPDRALVSCDGEDLASLVPGDRVEIARSGRVVTLIHPAGHDHFATLRGKLHWGREPC